MRASRWLGRPAEPTPESTSSLTSVNHDEAQARICRDLLRHAGVPTRRGRGDSDVPSALRGLGVTSREMDVLRLVAGGLSNGDIAGAALSFTQDRRDPRVQLLLAPHWMPQPAGAPWLPRPANSVLSTDPRVAASANTGRTSDTSVKEPWP